MSFFGSLFGKSESQRQHSSVSMPEWQRQIVEPLYKRGGQLGLEASNQGYTKYGGPSVAQYGPGGVDAMRKMVMAPSSIGYKDATNLAHKMTSGGFSNPYLQGIIDTSSRGITDNFNKTMRPQMDANMARQSAFGGSGWADANRDMSKSLAQALADNETGLRYNNYLNDIGVMERGAAMGLNAQQQYENAIGRTMDLAEQNRLIKQRGYDQEREDFNEQRDWIFRQLQGIQGGLGGQTDLYGNTQKIPGQGSDFMRTLGNVGKIASTVYGMPGA